MGPPRALYGLTVHQVEPGTIIKVGEEQMTVEEGRAVYTGASVYMTPTDYERLKAHPSIKPA